MTRLAMAMSPVRALEVCDEATRAGLESRFDVVWGGDHLDEAELDRLTAGADLLVTTWGTPRIPPRLLGGHDRPRAVAHAAGSVKNLVHEESLAQVAVFSGARRIALMVGEYCLAATLTLLRRFPQFSSMMGDRGWKTPETRGTELRGRTVGIVGASSTARAFLELLAPFHVDVVVYDPFLSSDGAAALGVRMGTLAETMQSDVVSIHVPNLPATEGMITRELIAQIPDGSVFVNSSRAPAVDTDAILDEARSGRLRVALDVFMPEPPNLPEDVLHLDNLLLSPHVAGDTREGRADLVRCVTDDAIAYLATGVKGPTWVNPALWAVLA